MNILTRYWFEFDISDSNIMHYSSYAGLKRGCGVTAYSYDDALQLLQQMLFKQDPIPKIVKVIEDIDISTLDEGHIMPNIGVSSYRGVWFPNMG